MTRLGRMTRRKSALVAGAALLTACELLGSLSEADRGLLTAAIRGTVAFNYEGTGEFYAGRDPRIGADPVLTVTSEGTGASSGQELILYGFAVVGDVRAYHLVSSANRVRQNSFTAIYIRQVGETYEAYTSLSGEVVITRSDDAMLEGDIAFLGLRYCAVPVTGTGAFSGSCDPRTLNHDAPSIDVTGSFKAVPSKDQDVRVLQRAIAFGTGLSISR